MHECRLVIIHHNSAAEFIENFSWSFPSEKNVKCFHNTQAREQHTQAMRVWWGGREKAVISLTSMRTASCGSMKINLKLITERFPTTFSSAFPNSTKAGLIFNWIFYWTFFPTKKKKLGRWERRIEIDEKLLGWVASSCLKIQKRRKCARAFLFAASQRGKNEWNKGSNEFHVFMKCFFSFFFVCQNTRANLRSSFNIIFHHDFPIVDHKPHRRIRPAPLLILLQESCKSKQMKKIRHVACEANNKFITILIMICFLLTLYFCAWNSSRTFIVS